MFAISHEWVYNQDTQMRKPMNYALFDVICMQCFFKVDAAQCVDDTSHEPSFEELSLRKLFPLLPVRSSGAARAVVHSSVLSWTGTGEHHAINPIPREGF